MGQLWVVMGRIRMCRGRRGVCMDQGRGFRRVCQAPIWKHVATLW